MSDGIFCFSNDSDWKVRQKTAASLHELAKLLGPEQTEEQLVATFESCFNDIDEVRTVMLRNLSSFLLRLGPEELSRELSNLVEFAECENENAWRYRQLMTQQLEKLIGFLSKQDINNYIWPMAKYYALDRVMAVRSEAFMLISKILMVALNRKDQNLISSVKEFIFKHFYSVESCRGKIAFIQICSILVKVIDYIWFSSNFGDALLSLQTSSLKDVKIALDKSLNTIESVHQREAMKRQHHGSVGSSSVSKMPITKI